MKRSAPLAVFVLAGLAACADRAVAPIATETPALARVASVHLVRVTSSADAGPGSFRQAVLDANADPAIGFIKFDQGLAIALQTPVVYTGAQALEIGGAGSVVDGGSLAAREGAFVANGGGHLSIRWLTVRNAPGAGITVLVPDAATGTFDVSLDEVRAHANGLHGVLINDQSGYLADPNSTSPAGSDAGLRVRITGGSFDRNGLTDIDQDGVRVNEGGIGDVGSAIFVVRSSTLTGNGSFTALDFDDGIDVDEAGAGDIVGRFLKVVVNDNFEQGVDLNENDAGDLRVTMQQVEASDNAEEGIEFEEDDDFAGGGHINAQLTDITTLRNGANDGDAALKLREKGDGNLVARLVRVISSDNDIAGILLREDAGGNLMASIVNATTRDNGDDGISFDENGPGNLEGSVQKAVSTGNDGAGVAASQQLPGFGTLRLQNFTGGGNTDGDVKSDAGVQVTQVPSGG